MKANVMSRLTACATCHRVDFEDNFKSFNNKISELKKSTYNSSNLPFEEHCKSIWQTKKFHTFLFRISLNLNPILFNKSCIVFS